MKKTLLGLMLLVCSAVAFSHNDNQADMIKNAICRATQWTDCKKVEPPIVVRSSSLVNAVQRTLPRGTFLRGFYIPGENYIYIRTDTGWIKNNETLVHESIHYYYDNTHPKSDKDNCKSEYLARYYTTKITGTPFDSTWWDRYNCPDYVNAAQP